MAQTPDLHAVFAELELARGNSLLACSSFRPDVICQTGGLAPRELEAWLGRRRATQTGESVSCLLAASWQSVEIREGTREEERAKDGPR